MLHLMNWWKFVIPIINKHAPVKKLTVRTVKSPWIGEKGIINCMTERDGAKGVTNKSGWLFYVLQIEKWCDQTQQK